MNIQQKLVLLKKLYGLFHSFTESETIACKLGCSHCCTQNVTLTSLEGLYLLESPDTDLAPFKDGLQTARTGGAFRPEVTINQIAQLCIENQPVPEETPDPGAGPCPLLTKNRCAVYEVRPFSCRCMMSAVQCRPSGSAEMKERWITAGTLFQQVIEHLDAGGWFGNLSDILWHLYTDEARETFMIDRIQPPPIGLLQNRPIPAVMIPPEQRDFFQPLWERIRSLLRVH